MLFIVKGLRRPKRWCASEPFAFRQGSVKSEANGTKEVTDEVTLNIISYRKIKEEFK